MYIESVKQRIDSYVELAHHCKRVARSFILFDPITVLSVKLILSIFLYLSAPLWCALGLSSTVLLFTLKRTNRLYYSYLRSGKFSFYVFALLL